MIHRNFQEYLEASEAAFPEDEEVAFVSKHMLLEARKWKQLPAMYAMIRRMVDKGKTIVLTTENVTLRVMPGGERQVKQKRRRIRNL